MVAQSEPPTLTWARKSMITSNSLTSMAIYRFLTDYSDDIRTLLWFHQQTMTTETKQLLIMSLTALITAGTKKLEKLLVD